MTSQEVLDAVGEAPALDRRAEAKQVDRARAASGPDGGHDNDRKVVAAVAALLDALKR
jgi:hypothetical protein